MFDSISPLIHRKTRRNTQILANRFVDFFRNKIEARASPLIHRKTRRNTQILANRFVDFFRNKIEAIRSDLFARQTPATNPFMDTQACNAKLPEFESMTEDQVN